MKADLSGIPSLLFDIWGTKKPLCALFSTDNNKYLYDSGTNKVLRCSKAEFDLLADLLEFLTPNDFEKYFSSPHANGFEAAALSIVSAVKNEHILRLTDINDFDISHHPDFVADKVLNELGMVLLELTQGCNLRCGYCIYNDAFPQKRSHAQITMSDEIAKASIDHLKRCSSRKDKISIGFYGGEPLLRWPTIQKATRYAKRVMPEKEINFSITTNGVLINQAIADFLAEERFHVLVSIDGPQEYHDQWRKDANGIGSFARTLAGLETLASSYSGTVGKLGMSIVYAPPYSERKVNRIHEFISSLSWLPEGMTVNITYPHEGTIYKEELSLNNFEERRYDYSLSNWAKTGFFEAYSKKNIPSGSANKINIRSQICQIDSAANIGWAGKVQPTEWMLYSRGEKNLRHC